MALRVSYFFPMRTILSLLASITTALAVGAGVESLQERSPFLPPSAPKSAAQGDALSSIELTGIFSLNGKPKFSVRDTSSGRSLWIGLGETEEGLTIRSYDESKSSVVIEGRGGSRNVVIREARVTTAPSTPIPIQVAGPPGQPARMATIIPNPPPQQQRPQASQPQQATSAATGPKTDAEKERDARLLVSDLLEISIQERKRYEENQRRATKGMPPLRSDEKPPQ